MKRTRQGRGPLAAMWPRPAHRAHHLYPAPAWSCLRSSFSLSEARAIKPQRGQFGAWPDHI